MRLAFKIAKRFLATSKSQTALIISAIAIGISVQLFLGLLISGLQSDLVDKTIGNASHISFTKNNELFDADYQVINSLKENNDITIVAPKLVQNSFVDVNGDVYSVAINGIDFDNNIYSLDQKLTSGSLPKNDDEIIIGSYYDKAKVGDKINLTLYDNKSKEYTISGIFDLGNKVSNEKTMYMNLNSLQVFSSHKDQLSVIETQVDKVFDTQKIVDGLSIKGYDITTWQKENASLLSALSSQSMSSIIIQVFILISVTLAISSVLIISVVQKSKQIGILKAMGLTNSNISKVFLSQGFILGTIGSLLGVLLGVGLILSFSMFALDETGKAVINIKLDPSFITTSFLIGVFVASIASLIPARKSKKLSAMEVISNG